MPDAEIMAQIKQREAQRAWRALDMLNGAIGPRAELAEALGVLAEDWRATADLYDKAKLKGAMSAHIVPLRHAAAELDKVIKSLEQPRSGTDSWSTNPPPAKTLADLTPEQMNAVAVQQCPAPQGHGAHTWICGPASTEAWCTGKIVPGTGDLTGLDALIADSMPGKASTDGGRIGEQGECCENMMVEDEDPRPWCECESYDDMARGHAGSCRFQAHLRADHDRPYEVALRRLSPRDEVSTLAYLKGESDDLPAEPPRGRTHWPAGPEEEGTAFPGMLTAGELAMLPGAVALDPTPEHVIHAAREIGAQLPTSQIPVPLLGQPGDAGAGYDPAYIPPGGTPYTYTDLLTPVPLAALPPHLSHSQAETIGDCAAKYRLQRVESDRIPQIPQWALIGGDAFHAATENWERVAVELGSEAMLTAADPEAAWRHAFDAAVAEVEQSSPVPRSLWRASKRGAEGETWWNANGPEMLRRYLAARPAEQTAQHPVAGPFIEQRIQVTVPTAYGPLPFEAILDRVTIAPDGDTLVIRDYKTGDRMPDSAEQLAEQAWAVALRENYPPDVEPLRILGTFFNARKGTWTEPVDLLGEYSFEWFVYRVTTAHAQKLALTTGPTPARPSSFCGGCSVRWACPVKGPKR